MSKKIRLALIVSSEVSSWGSCRVITPNLVTSYLESDEFDCRLFSYTSPMNQVEIFSVAKKILHWKPDRIVFLDHAPHPLGLLRALDYSNKEKPLVPLFFHLYGDFTLYPSEWLGSGEILSKTKVKLLCASWRQKNLVQSFLKKGGVNTDVCVFPVDTSFYKPDFKLRTQKRHELGLKESDSMILYTGRLSDQKNILRLTSEMIKTMKENKSTYFFLAGSFDNLGAPFFNRPNPLNSLIERWTGLISSLPDSIKRRIHYFGQISAEELKKLYNAADLYVSLSTHHDEDFGMSPAEGLCCGTPAVLSSWGGFGSFKIHEATELVDIRITDQGLKISSSDVQGRIRSALSLPRDASSRKKRAVVYTQVLSIKSVSKSLPQILAENINDFVGFNSHLKNYSLRFKKYKNGQYLYGNDMGPKSFYYRVYSNYIRN